MKARLRLAICGLLVGVAIYGLWPRTALRHPPGVLVAAEPEQHLIAGKPLPAPRGWTLDAAATYSIKARVLHTRRYWDGGSGLVPYDVALGWGPMSDQAVLDRLKISQSTRFMFYQWEGVPPIPGKEIGCHSSNNHVIAANPEVAAVIRKLRTGQIVTLRGFLVNATSPEGGHWNTSLTRMDDGPGACELFYIESARAEDDVI
jgi:hypothetical protein